MQHISWVLMNVVHDVKWTVKYEMPLLKTNVQF